VDTLSVTYTMAPSTCLTGAAAAFSTDSEPADPQYTEVFDPAACRTSYTFAMELPSELDDVNYLFVTATGTVQKVTGGVASADLGVSVPGSPVEYDITG
jgi:hypothetical protein